MRFVRWVPWPSPVLALLLLVKHGTLLKAYWAGEEIYVNVTLTVGFRRGDREFEEGLFSNLHVDEEGIQLDVLRTTYSSNVGSDFIRWVRQAQRACTARWAQAFPVRLGAVEPSRNAPSS